MSLPLSVIIIAKNEQVRIKECLESIYQWADEIVIVDDESTDHTVKIAQAFTNKIFTRRMDLEGKQRNFGVSKAKNDWVMMLDCDERPTSELKNEIEAVLNNKNNDIVAFWVPQINFLGKFELKHGGWSSPHIRLYNKNYLEWSEASYDVVHPGVKYIKEGAKGGNLKGALIHYNFANIEDFIKKVNRHSTLEAVKWHLSGKKITFGKTIWRTVDRFFRRYIGKGGYKDGYYGFVGAVLSGFYQWAAYSKYREIKEHGTYLEAYK